MLMHMKKNELGDKVFIATGEDSEFKCSQCREDVEVGFVCEDNDEFILCVKCQKDYKMERCGYDQQKEHKHIKFTHEL